MVECLLARGDVDPDAASRAGATPLLRALSNRREDLGSAIVACDRVDVTKPSAVGD
jgi:hypothetical protein